MFTTYEQASIFLELLTNAGWSDDADELIHDHIQSGDYSTAEMERKMGTMQNMIDEANKLMPDQEKMTTNIYNMYRRFTEGR